MIIGIINLILVFFFVMLFIGAMFVFRIIYSLFNVRNQFNRMGENMRNGNTRQKRSSNKETVYDNRSQQKTERKIFSDDEGEYVDFEEVKD